MLDRLWRGAFAQKFQERPRRRGDSPIAEGETARDSFPLDDYLVEDLVAGLSLVLCRGFSIKAALHQGREEIGISCRHGRSLEFTAPDQPRKSP